MDTYSYLFILAYCSFSFHYKQAINTIHYKHLGDFLLKINNSQIIVEQLIHYLKRNHFLSDPQFDDQTNGKECGVHLFC